MEELFTVKIPFPFFISGRKVKTRTLLSLNNVSRWKRKQTEIKNEFKQSLREIYLPEPAFISEELTIQYRVVRHTKLRFDSQDNAVYALKWLGDVIEEMGYIKDDTNANIQSFPTLVDKSLPETMLQVRLMAGSDSW